MLLYLKEMGLLIEQLAHFPQGLKHFSYRCNCVYVSRLQRSGQSFHIFLGLAAQAVM